MQLKEPLTMSIPELAAVLGCSEYLAYSLAKKNELPVKVIRIGRRLLVSRKAVMNLLETETNLQGGTNCEK